MEVGERTTWAIWSGDSNSSAVTALTQLPFVARRGAENITTCCRLLIAATKADMLRPHFTFA